MIAAPSTYRLRIVPWRDSTCVRVIEFHGDQTLWDVHRAIQNGFDLDDDHCWAFHLSGDYGDRETEYQGTPEGPRTRWPARLDALDLVPGMRIAYVYDFGDDLRHDIEVLEVGSSDPDKKYPLVVEQQGKPPRQYHWQVEEVREAPSDVGLVPFEPDMSETLRQLYESFAAACDRSEDDRHSPETLDADLALARRLFDACPDLDSLSHFNSLFDASVEAWIKDVVNALLHAKRVEEAVELLRRLLATTQLMEHRIRLSMVLCAAGRNEEALALLDEATPTDTFETDTLALSRAELMILLRREVEAEAILRGLLARRWLSGRVRGRAVGALTRLLNSSGRKAEAERLLVEEQQLLDHRTHPNPPEKRDGPKVGRNDPCPCGSGKKFKKCCGK